MDQWQGGAPERVIIPIHKFSKMEKFANAVMTKTKHSSRATFELLKDTPTMQHRLECFHERPKIVSLKLSSVNFRPSLQKVFFDEIVHIVGKPNETEKKENK